MYQSSVQAFIFNLVAKVQIFIKLLMYVLSHGCLLISYKDFFNSSYHVYFQWLQMSLRILCLISMRSLVLRILSCIPKCFHLLHDGATNFPSRIDTASQTSLFLTFFIAGRFCINDVTTFVILFFILNCCHLFFRTSLIILCLLVGDYVCDLSYKSNAFVWLETFHKEYSYWKILMLKYMIMKLLQLVQHSSISHRNFYRCLPSLPGQH